jgi:hypothetical protein
MFVHRLRLSIDAMIAVLGNIDAWSLQPAWVKAPARFWPPSREFAAMR